MSILVHIQSYQDREALVLACDDSALEWLCRKFGLLVQSDSGNPPDFVLGDRCEQGIAISVKLTDGSTPSRIIHQGDRFIFYLSRDDAQRFQGLVKGLKACRIPSHQYLESDDPLSPVLILSKGEYDDGTLRSMGTQ